jgi:hypothetical protein
MSGISRESDSFISVGRFGIVTRQITHSAKRKEKIQHSTFVVVEIRA